uniref:Uncharacterized protein n=1 Tax=Sphaerodactylus townsendi TaxID=933632 RepID=A0ACB8ECR9_9SAUR
MKMWLASFYQSSRESLQIVPELVFHSVPPDTWLVASPPCRPGGIIHSCSPERGREAERKRRNVTLPQPRSLMELQVRSWAGEPSCAFSNNSIGSATLASFHPLPDRSHSQFLLSSIETNVILLYNVGVA